VSAGWVVANGNQWAIDDITYNGTAVTKGPQTNCGVSGVDGTNFYCGWGCSGDANSSPISQQPNSVYYVYLVHYPGGNCGGQTNCEGVLLNEVVISDVPPTHDAYPSQFKAYDTIWALNPGFYPDALGGWSCYTNNDTNNMYDLVFIGSYMTDGNGDIIPFSRQGKKVLFTTPVSTPGSWTNGGIWNWTWRPFGAGAQSEVIKWNPIPASASALIVSASGWNWDTTSAYTFFVLDPLGLGAPVQQGGNWKFNTQAVFFINQARAATQGGSFQFQEGQLQIKPDSSGNVTVWTQTAPLGQNLVDIDMSLAGYVEDIRSPGP
jgi:hypothetical protein